MKAVFEKEWLGYFRVSVGYVFVAVFIALCSFFFIHGALIYQSADLNVIFSNINIVYLFLVSILTMGLFSNERSKKTEQLLFTSPVKITSVVAGKYFAALMVFGITLLLSLIYPIILFLFGNPSITEIIGVYIGFILIWSVFIAIGMFISSITENQMIAAVVTFGTLIVVSYMESIAANISNNVLRTVVRWFSVLDRYSEFQTGILNIESILYFLSFAFVFVFLTSQSIKRRQYSDKKNRINNMVVTVSVIAGLILANATVSSIAAKTSLKIDLTREKVYGYSEHTKQVLASLEKEVQIYALYPESSDGSFVGTMREYLDQYELLSDRIKVIYKDPYTEPAFVHHYGDDIPEGSVIVVQGEKSKVIPIEKLYRQSPYGGALFIDAENQLTSAIGYVSGTEKEKKFYFIKGHNEYVRKDSFLQAELENSGYHIGETVLATDGIPEDADLIVSLAPTADLTPEERDMTDEYLLGGGKALFVLSAGTPAMERLYGYLAEWGITVNDDFVIENDSSLAYQSKTGIPIPAPQLQMHQITEKLMDSDVPFIAPNSCSFTLNENNIQNAIVTPLLQTSKDSWGITDLSTTSLEKKDGDINGPLTISALSEQNSVGGGKIFVIGSLQAIESEGALTDSSYCNGDFVLNTCAYLTDKGELLGIRAKKISKESLTMTEQQLERTALLIQYVIPILIIIAGLAVWLRRRHL